MRREIPRRQRGFARAMRNDPTGAEAAMWEMLRGKRLEGLRFRRQHPIDGYIVDFICLDEKLIVEVDGGQHSTSATDAFRDNRLSELGYRVIRFWNNDVLKDGDAVARQILFQVGKRWE
jgi:very-short-patch-repair endonuclease